MTKPWGSMDKLVFKVLVTVSIGSIRWLKDACHLIESLLTRTIQLWMTHSVNPLCLVGTIIYDLVDIKFGYGGTLSILSTTPLSQGSIGSPLLRAIFNLISDGWLFSATCLFSINPSLGEIRDWWELLGMFPAHWHLSASQTRLGDYKNYLTYRLLVVWGTKLSLKFGATPPPVVIPPYRDCELRWFIVVLNKPRGILR